MSNADRLPERSRRNPADHAAPARQLPPGVLSFPEDPGHRALRGVREVHGDGYRPRLRSEGRNHAV